MKAYTNIFKNLVTLRGSATQEMTAKALGVKRARYSHWELGMIEPPLYMLMKIAKYYNVTIEQLLTELPSITY